MSWFLSPDGWGIFGPHNDPKWQSPIQGDKACYSRVLEKFIEKFLTILIKFFKHKDIFYMISPTDCQIFVHLIKYAGTFFMSSFACKRQAKKCVNFL